MHFSLLTIKKTIEKFKFIYSSKRYEKQTVTVVTVSKGNVKIIHSPQDMNTCNINIYKTISKTTGRI